MLNFQYAEAEKDASVALDFHPGSLKAHLSKASSLYNLGLFEYALMNYHRFKFNMFYP